jgi:endonuclease/exonuclease/phosphatase family metal-dependent hydrolase
MVRHVARAATLAALGALLACRGGTNYGSTLGPRYEAAAPACGSPRADADLLVVTYNVAFSRKVDEAIRVLRDTPELSGADVVLLQEMTAGATARIAGALGLGYVYYPAIHHRRARQDFGNAVLSRWPIQRDEKLVLPHRSRYARTQRTATVATLVLDTLAIQVYSTHLGTAADVSSRRRREQLETILRHAAPSPTVIVGGDMNMSDLGAPVRAHVFRWPTSRLPRTTRFGRWDHVLVRGDAFGEPVRSGVVAKGMSASDHGAVWVRLPLRVRPAVQPLPECPRKGSRSPAAPASPGAPP